jgi:predicted transposase/invertase (TIGR01784 family)
MSSDIDNTAYRASYDRCCKQLLSHKSILAHILKECVEEFKDFDTHYIEENCIENKPEISEVAVHRDSKQPEKIMGANTEDTSVDEGTVFYDIRFVAVVPQTGESIRLIINLEAQNSFHPGYSLVRRGLYYCCRLISSQYETEFTGDNYNDIKKVYSIWICTDVPEYARNTITHYRVSENNVVGKIKDDKKNYDIINVIMVCLDKDSEEVDNENSGVLKLLRVLLSDRVNPDNKKTVLNSNYDIEMEFELEKEMSGMCNLSAGVWNRGVLYGREEGKEEGIGIGEDNKSIEFIKKIMENLHYTFEQTANLLGLSDEDKAKFIDKL